MRRFGFGVASADVVSALGQLQPAGQDIAHLAGVIRTSVAAGMGASDLVSIATAAEPVFARVKSFHQAFSGVSTGGMSAQSLQTLPEELFDLLLTDYLTRRAPVALHALALLDVAAPQFVRESGDPGSRGLAYTRTLYRWDRIGLLFEDADAWARQAYGWGVSFDSGLFIRRLVAVFEYIGGMAELRDMTRAQALVFAPALADAPAKPLIALAPLVKPQGAAGGAAMSGEFGLALLPAQGSTPATAASDAGLAISPYVEGAVSQTVNLSNRLAINLSGAVGGMGGVVFAFRPSGASHQLGLDAVAFNGQFGAELIVKPAQGQSKIVLIGDPGSTRLEIDSASVAVGGGVSNASAEFFAAGGVKALHLVVDASQDGFLGLLLGGPIEVTAGDLLVGWRSGRGVYFEGGSSLDVKIPIDKQIGPFHLQEIDLGLDWKDAFKTTVAITADARLGPIYAMVAGLGLTATLQPNPNGALGKFDIVFGLKLPTGYAIALDAPPISGGGLLDVRDNEYRGALALKFETFGLSAFGILNTRLPGGQRGFSFVASIFGDFVVPLGYGFFLTGLGGLIGINRTTNTDALRDVLYAGQLDSILFPHDPIANASTILDNMAAIFPPREGQFLFGPMARISFSQPPLIEGKLGIVLEIGDEARLLILGMLESNLPTREAALVVLSVSFFGEIDFSAGKISFDATLQNSRVLFWSVSGDMAVRTGWGPHIEQVVSFGGLHPRYPRPANLPDLRRMAINFGTNNPRVSLWAYQALTLNSLQFGAGADLYAKGPKIPFVGRLAAEGHVYFHALIYFNPFAFDIQLGGSLSLLVDGDVVLGLGFDLRLTGPNNFVIDGKVWATVFGIDVDFGIRHEWGDKRSLPVVVADPVETLRNALLTASTMEPVATNVLADGVRFAQASPGDATRPVSPVGGLRLSQKALPLGVRIEKLGEAEIAGAARAFDLAVFPANAPGAASIGTRAADIEFVHGHFWKLSEADRLRAPAYDLLKSGFEIAASDKLEIDFSRARTSEYGYELVMIGDESDALASPLFAFSNAVAGDLSRWMAAEHRAFVSPLDGRATVSPAADRPLVNENRFAPAGVTVGAGPFADIGLRVGESARNPIVADYLMAGA